MLTRIAVTFHALAARRLEHAQLFCIQTLAKLFFANPAHQACACTHRINLRMRTSCSNKLNATKSKNQGSKSGALARQIARTWHACCVHNLQTSHTNMLHSGSEGSPVEKVGADLYNAGTAAQNNGSRMPRTTRLMSQL